MTQQATETKKSESGKSKLAALLVRGLVNADHPVKKTCALLHLHRRLHCVVIDDTSINRGMLIKIKDFVAFGPVSEETVKQMDKRKKKDAYALHPPRGGFERGGIKKVWKQGGVLGERDEMDSLLAKML